MNCLKSEHFLNLDCKSSHFCWHCQRPTTPSCILTFSNLTQQLLYPVIHHFSQFIDDLSSPCNCSRWNDCECLCTIRLCLLIIMSVWCASRSYYKIAIPGVAGLTNVSQHRPITTVKISPITFPLSPTHYHSNHNSMSYLRSSIGTSDFQ